MKAILIGNYGPDRQESMLRFTTMLGAALTELGWTVELQAPTPWFTRLLRNCQQRGIAKWMGYLDKYILFPLKLRKLRAQPDTVIHIIDHSNAMYTAALAGAPVVVTCHDLLAVRGALGEDTACPATPMGRLLQKQILRGLERAPLVACVSAFTHGDLQRLLPQKPAGESTVVPNGMNYPYRRLEPAEVLGRLRAFPTLDPTAPFVLHVGSNLPRKNKPTVLRAFARLAPGTAAQLVMAGPPLSDELMAQARELGIADRLVVLEKPDNAQLEALYNRALALVFPSLGEGFGWPVVEAQACGCPVICANATALPEVGGEGVQLVEPLDDAAIAAAVDRLAVPAERQKWSERALCNAQRFSTEKMARAYESIYLKLLRP